MKKILPLLSFVIINLFIYAQVPESLNYQAVARNNAGVPLPNSSIAVRISIRDVSVSGTVLYSERDTATTNAFGLFTCKVGTGNIISGIFAGIDWASGDKYMQVELDPTGGSSYANMGTTQLISVPYALHAKTAHVADTVLNLPAPPPPPVSVWDTAGNNIYNTNSGKVGIGTSTPSYPLEISSSLGAGLLKLTSTVASTQITMDDSGTDDVYLTSTQGQFDIWTGGNNQRLTVLSNGNVGIGNTTPSNPLSVIGNANFTGNVGIGTTNPSYPLHVVTGSGGSYVLHESTTSGSSPFGYELYSSDASWYLLESGGVATPGSLSIHQGFAGTRMYFETNGNVGVGTLSPTAKLSVNGTADKPGGGSWAVFSDARLKTDVSGFTDGLGVVQKINPVWFRYNGKAGMPTDKMYVGILAQDMQNVAPYTVSKVIYNERETEGIDPLKGNGGKEVKVTQQEYLSFDPSALDFILINAVKEQQKLIEEMQKEIDALKNR